MKKGYLNLREHLQQQGIRQKDIAKEMGIGQGTFSRKLSRAGLDFTLDEARWIGNKLKVEADILFRFFFEQDLSLLEVESEVMEVETRTTD